MPLIKLDTLLMLISFIGFFVGFGALYIYYALWKFGNTWKPS